MTRNSTKRSRYLDHIHQRGKSCAQAGWLNLWPCNLMCWVVSNFNMIILKSRECPNAPLVSPSYLCKNLHLLFSRKKKTGLRSESKWISLPIIVYTYYIYICIHMYVYIIYIYIPIDTYSIYDGIIIVLRHRRTWVLAVLAAPPPRLPRARARLSHHDAEVTGRG
jgi:hypothetical protein